MIPVQLQVKNFMSYGEDVPPLRFDGMHVVCLSGPNGHGKSALLDAMTWALWGRSRAASDDDLIRHGQTAMMVDFEFDLEGLRYRVRRERVKRGKRSQGALEFYVWDEQSKQWRSLSEPSMRATQRRIIDTVKLDYETFINSAYLKQGRADEFTTKTPAQRKRILAEILRLDQYEVLEQRAKEKVRAIEQEIALVSGSIQHIEEEISHEEEYRASLEQETQRLALLEKEREAAEARERELQSQVNMLKQRQADVQRQLQRVRQVEQEVRQLDEERAALEAQLQQMRDFLAQAEQIHSRYQALQDARREEEALSTLLQQQVTLQKALQDAQNALSEARVRVERDVARLQQQWEQLESTTRQADTARQTLEEAQNRLAHFATLEQELAQAREELSTIRDEGTETRARTQQLEQRIEELKERIAQLQGVRDRATCPLCGQPLTEEHVTRMLAELREELDGVKEQLAGARARLATLVNDYKAREKDIKELERTLQQRVHWQQRQAQAEQQLQQAEQAAAKQVTVAATLQEKRTLLEENTFAPELHARVQEIQAELIRLGYDPEAHEKVRARLAELADAESEYHQLQAAREKRRDYESRLEALQAKRQQWEETLARERALLASMQEEIAALPDVEREWRQQVARVDALAGQERDLRALVGGLRQQLAAIKEQRRRLQELEKKRRSLEEEKVIFQELAQAFGRNGLQAMIIEAVLPEIEQEANRLLARMTNGRMSVRLKSQRDLRTGGTAETLDIEIADDVGARPYEMYSGGEAFRINFALRVALSKLLARRAGASLRSLFIDEGFGSQDSEGRLRLVDAINAIQDDFALIVVITHIEELKEAFPVRIDVEKGPQGSTYTIS